MSRSHSSAATAVLACGTSIPTTVSMSLRVSFAIPGRSRLMFLSKLALNLRNPKTRCDLARPYEMHRTLMNNYPHARVEHRCDLLFRVEPSRSGPPIVLVQTRD